MESSSLAGWILSNSCQQFWSLESNSHPEPISSSSHQWFWSALTPESNSQTGCVFMLVVLIYSNTREQLTNWIHVQPFLSVSLICSNTGEQLTCWMFRCSCQWFWSAQSMESDSQTGHVISNSCQWFWLAQTLDSNSQSRQMFSQSCHWFWFAQVLKSDSLAEGMFHSCQQFWSAKTQKATHRLDECVFSHSHQWFWSDQTLEWLTIWMHVQPFLSVVLICSWRVTHMLDRQFSSVVLKQWSDSHPGHMLATLISGSHLIKHWRTTHLLDTCSATLVSVSICLNTKEQLTC